MLVCPQDSYVPNGGASGPFYSPKGPRSHWSFIWKLQNFSVYVCTGPSGGTPDSAQKRPQNQVIASISFSGAPDRLVTLNDSWAPRRDTKVAIVWDHQTFQSWGPNRSVNYSKNPEAREFGRTGHRAIRCTSDCPMLPNLAQTSFDSSW